MNFCNKCGNKLEEGVRFCDKCGAPTSAINNETFVCPNCKQPAKSFEIKCPICGYEFRTAKSASSISDFQKNLAELEVKNTASNYNYKYIDTNSKSEDSLNRQKRDLISTYPIPNTKEDILEFMILASANFDENYYLSHLNEEDVSDAWLAKIKQCYQKARISFHGDPSFSKIQDIYDDVMAKISAPNKKTAIINQNAPKKSIDANKTKEKNDETTPQTKRKKAIIPIFISIIAVALIIFLFLNNNDKISDEPQLTVIGISHEDLIAMNAEQALELLDAQGFYNFSKTMISVKENPEAKDGDIAEITISGRNDFTAADAFEKNVKIAIKYYVSPIAIGVESTHFEKQQYSDAVAYFESLGFTNVTTSPLKDLVTGWISKENTVESITINGQSNFSSSDEFMPDAKIKIYYHSFKNK